MTYRQAFPLLGIVLMLVGCVRTSPDSFDTVGSQGNEVVIPADPTEADDGVDVVVIDPDADPAEAQADDEAEDVEPTATNRVVVPATATGEPEEVAPTTAPRNADDDDSAEAAQADDDVQVTSTPQVVPTATDFEFITPDVVEEVVQPTAVPTEVTVTATLQPTPTGEGDVVTLGTCDYEVQANDNLFRIAINNDVSLDALLAENGLTEASIIQPGQILTIPNCDAPEEEVVAETEVETVDGEVVLPEECTYEVQENDTLFQIALDNDVTLDDLFAENGLTQNSVLQVGQELLIPLPQCDIEPSASSATNSDEDVEAGATTGDTIIYVVNEDDTLLSIAQTYGVTPNDIIQANTIPDPNNLTPGQELVIPTGE
ncbi:MAG: LysM peptidoglycan-binding domain-containing protein [Chloroflexota bacterium]